MDLTQSRCKPCEGGIAPMERQEIDAHMNFIHPDWKIISDKVITREFRFVNFRHAMDFVNHVANLAEEEGHHPVMRVNFASVILELWTHAIGGLSMNDFILAAKIDRM